LLLDKPITLSIPNPAIPARTFRRWNVLSCIFENLHRYICRRQTLRHFGSKARSEVESGSAESTRRRRSLAKAIAAHDSPGYQEALRVLGDAAERDLRIIEGVS
jgi:uncharacterized protein (DUF1330 family)